MRRILAALLAALLLASVASLGVIDAPKPAHAFITSANRVMTGGVGTACDSHFAQVTSVLNLNGNINDAAGSPPTWVNHASIGFSSTTPFVGTQSLGQLDGSTQWLSTVTNLIRFNAATTPFSLEFWANMSRLGSGATDRLYSTGVAVIYFMQMPPGTDEVTFSTAAGSYTSPSLARGSFNFYQAIWDGAGHVSLSIDAITVYTAADATDYTTAGTSGFQLGANGVGTQNWQGYFGPFRVTNGYARPVAVPLAPFPTHSC